MGVSAAAGVGALPGNVLTFDMPAPPVASRIAMLRYLRDGLCRNLRHRMGSLRG